MSVTIKSPREIELMREAGRILALVHENLEKEILDYLNGVCTLEEAIYILKRDTRHFAKRQLTWFRHEEEAVRLYIDNPDGSMRASEELIEEAETVVSDLIKRIKEI